MRRIITSYTTHRRIERHDWIGIVCESVCAGKCIVLCPVQRLRWNCACWTIRFFFFFFFILRYIKHKHTTHSHSRMKRPVTCAHVQHEYTHTDTVTVLTQWPQFKYILMAICLAMPFSRHIRLLPRWRPDCKVKIAYENCSIWNQAIFFWKYLMRNGCKAFPFNSI